MPAKKRLVIAAGRPLAQVPRALASLHAAHSVGEELLVKLSPKPSSRWGRERAEDLLIGAGFEVQSSFLLGGRVLLQRWFVLKACRMPLAEG